MGGELCQGLLFHSLEGQTLVGSISIFKGSMQRTLHSAAGGEHTGEDWKCSEECSLAYALSPHWQAGTFLARRCYM